jgi:group I intron endonuclease
MTGIYKITNKINGKSYIGQSVRIEKRWANHRYRAFQDSYPEYESPLYRAIRKYSINNFTFEIIEECLVADLNKRERYWITHYDTFYNGYNQTLGGENGASLTYSSKEAVAGIIEDLETTDLRHHMIAEKWNISTEMVQGINTGRYWKHDREYPIQTTYGRDITPQHCIDCNKIIDRKATRCVKCFDIAQRKVERPSKEKLLTLVLSTSMLQIARDYKVSDNTVRKWCMSYGLPYRREDILNYGKTEEEIAQGQAIKEKNKRYAGVSVLQLDANTEEVLARYQTASDAGRAMDSKGGGSHISSVCLGKRKTAYGYKWKYANE